MRKSGQQGYVLLVAIIAIILAGGVFAFGNFKSNQDRGTDRRTANDQNFQAISVALAAYVSANGRLPCPAAGTATTGVAVPETAITTCTNPDGIVPWATLGIAESVAMDAYDNRISYRVFSGTTGLTQTDGASLTNCDTVTNASTAPSAISPGLTCRTDHNTTDIQFMAGSKGFALTYNGTSVSNAAFALISHGSNGLGAYTRAGTRNTLPNVSSTEYGNTQANGPFVAKAAVTAELDPTSATYFDDTMAYLTVTELISKAKVSARNWPDPATLVATTFDATSVQVAATAAGHTVQQVNAVAFTLNTPTLTIGTTTLTAGGVAGNELDTRQGTSGTGVGVIADGGTTLSYIRDNDILTLSFAGPGRKLGLMLVDFGSVLGRDERAQLIFKNGATTVLTTTVQSCRAGSVLSSYSIDVGADFTSVELSALTRVSSANSSDFLLGEVALCSSTASTCTTTNANAGTACAYP